MKHTHNKSIILSILAILVLTNSYSQTQDDYSLLEEANKNYTNGKYEEAVQKYQKLVNAGFSAAHLYYNLGNAYYRTGNYKAAILYYEKAKLLAPDDDNIQTNLEYSKRFIKDKLEAVPQFFLLKWRDGFVNLFSEKGWAIFSITSFLLFLAAIIVFLFTKTLILRKLSFYFGALSIFLSIISFYSANKQNQRLTNHNTAIVFSPAVTVKSSPNDSGTDLFIIHEGLKVEILGYSGDWIEIKLSDGKVGWLPGETIEGI